MPLSLVLPLRAASGVVAWFLAIEAGDFGLLFLGFSSIRPFVLSMVGSVAVLPVSSRVRFWILRAGARVVLIALSVLF